MCRGEILRTASDGLRTRLRWPFWARFPHHFPPRCSVEGACTKAYLPVALWLSWPPRPSSVSSFGSTSFFLPPSRSCPTEPYYEPPAVARVNERKRISNYHPCTKSSDPNSRCSRIYLLYTRLHHPQHHWVNR